MKWTQSTALEKGDLLSHLRSLILVITSCYYYYYYYYYYYIQGSNSTCSLSLHRVGDPLHSPQSSKPSIRNFHVEAITCHNTFAGCCCDSQLILRRWISRTFTALSTLH